MSNNELASKARELKELKATAEELNAEITALEDEIKAVMTERNVDELRLTFSSSVGKPFQVCGSTAQG